MMTETRRVFFALWPDSKVRDAIVRQRERLDPHGGRKVPDHNLHLTLLFLGDQPVEAVRSLLDWPVPPVGAFTLRLDRFGWFAGARVAWLGGPRCTEGEALVSALADQARLERLRFDARRWVPHVTLFRRVARRPAAAEPVPVNWRIREFAVIESRPGRPYQVLRSWSLDSRMNQGNS